MNALRMGIIRELTTDRLAGWLDAEAGQYDIDGIVAAQSAAELQDVYDMTPAEFAEMAAGYELVGD